jgi:hypothetical protein
MTYGVVRAFQVIVNTLELSPEKAALNTLRHEHPPECGPTVVQSRCSGVFPMTLCRSRLLGDVKSLR